VSLGSVHALDQVKSWGGLGNLAPVALTCTACVALLQERAAGQGVFASFGPGESPEVRSRPLRTRLVSRKRLECDTVSSHLTPLSKSNSANSHLTPFSKCETHPFLKVRYCKLTPHTSLEEQHCKLTPPTFIKVRNSPLSQSATL